MIIDLNARVGRSKFFRWHEVLKLNTWGVHVFPTDKQYLNMMRFIEKCDQVRAFLNRPMIVTSGIRPRHYNDWNKPYGIGGARFSAHKLGRALDFYCKGLSCDEIREILKPKLELFQIRLEDKPGASWVHIDDMPARHEKRAFRY